MEKRRQEADWNRFKGAWENWNCRQWVETIVFKSFGSKWEQRNGKCRNQGEFAVLFFFSFFFYGKEGKTAGVKSEQVRGDERQYTRGGVDLRTRDGPSCLTTKGNIGYMSTDAGWKVGIFSMT